MWDMKIFVIIDIELWFSEKRNAKSFGYSDCVDSTNQKFTTFKIIISKFI